MSEQELLFMDMSLLSKGAVAEVNERPKPSLVSVGSRVITSDFRWHHHLIADHLLDSASDKWWTVAELARTAYGGASIDNKRRVRRNLPGLFAELLNRNFLLVREFEGRRVARVKLFSPKSEAERQSAVDKIEQLRNTAENAETKWRKAALLLAAA